MQSVAKGEGSRRKKFRPVREARHEWVVTYYDLVRLHREREPRELRGDYRTPKSNAMKRGHDPARRSRKLRAGEKPYRAARDKSDAQFSNPNKGACGTKVLPIDKFWKQEVVLERWRHN